MCCIIIFIFFKKKTPPPASCRFGRTLLSAMDAYCCSGSFLVANTIESVWKRQTYVCAARCCLGSPRALPKLCAGT